MSGPRIGFEISAAPEFRQVLGDVTKLLESLPAQLQTQLAQSGNVSLNRGSGAGPAPSQMPLPPQRPPEESEENKGAGYSDGERMSQGGTAAVAGDVQADASELKSGGFAGIFDRRYQAGRSAAMTAHNVDERTRQSERRRRNNEKRAQDYEERKSAWEQAGAGFGGSGPPGSGGGSQGGKSIIRHATFERVELTPTAARLLARTLARHGFKPGGSAGGGRGSGGGGGAGLGGQAGDSVQGVGSTLPVVGAIMGLAGMAMRFGSALSQMYQQGMESQDATLGAFGGYTGGGGGYVRNSELAQIQLSRARLSKDGKTRGFLGNQGGSGLDIRYGLSQGIGGSQGAMIAGQMDRYGTDRLSAKEFRKVVNAGDAAGFGGLRNAEFTEGIAGQMKQSYESGYGTLDASNTARDVAALHKRGLRPENALSVHANMTRGFQSEGNLLQSLAVAGGMQSGKSFMESTVLAEQGATARNRASAASLLGLDNMDPEMRALVESKVLKLGTATQAMTANKNGRGGLISGLENESVSSSGETFAGVNRKNLSKQYLRTANSIEETVVGSKVAQGANQLQGKIVDGMIGAYKASETVMMGFVDGMGTMNKKISEMAESMDSLIKKLDFF